VKRNSEEIAPLPNVAYTAGGGTIAAPAAGSVDDAIDVSSGRKGFILQVIGISASVGQTIAVDGSLDEGTTWVQITSSMKKLTAADAAVTPPIAADGIFEFPVRFPGMVRIRCVAAGAGTPGSAFLNWQDSRTQ